MSASDSSSSVVSSSVPILAVVSDKKPRVPTLPAKFAKFMQFGFFLMQKLKGHDGSFATLDDAAWLNLLEIHSSVDDQQAFVQQFFDASKDINKELRKLVADKKKADVKAAKMAAKPPKEPKEKATKEKVTKEKVTKEKATKEKVTKEKVTKEKVTKESTAELKADADAEADADADAEADADADVTVLQPTVVEKAKKGKAKKASVIDPFVEELVTLANAPSTTADKPKRKYNKKTSLPTNSYDPSNLDELLVEEHTIDGKLFLLSSDSRLFDPLSWAQIGILVDGLFVPI